MAIVTWEGDTSTDYNDGLNWSSGAVPGIPDTALFNNSFTNQPTIGPLGSGSHAGWTFQANTTITFSGGNTGLFFYGAGIVNNGGNVTVNSSSTANFLNFFNSSSAGNAIINANAANGSVQFANSATGANAAINLATGTGLVFVNSSTAGDANITSNLGTVSFRDNSKAGTSSITSTGAVEFKNNSTADHATIFNDNANFVHFEDSSKAGSAVITNHRTVEFLGSSSAENATIINKGSSTAVKTEFKDQSTGGNARLVAEANATVDFSFSNGPANNNKLSAGSIEGGGAFRLGDNELTVGSNNLSTAVNGLISDGGGGGCSGGSLVKVGAGTLFLNGNNSYTGLTTVAAGALGGVGTIGALVVGAGAAVSPGASAGILHTGTAQFAAGAALTVEIGGTAAGSGHDQLQVNGLVGLGKANLSVALINGFDPSSSVAQSFVVVNIDGSADLVSDTFSGLAEGAQLTVGNRLFSITYKGGDGNDVVLISGGAKIVGTAGIDLISASQAPAGQHPATDLADDILGLAGDDTIDARGGDDVVNGGAGRDKVVGGLGADGFAFTDKLKKTNADHIADFQPGTDEIRLDLDIFTKLKLGDLKKKAFFASKNADEGHDGNDRIVVDKKSGECWYDKDGQGGAKAKLFAILDGSPDDISFTDFVIVA